MSYAYQDDAVAALVGSDRTHYLAFDAGLGKTKVALDTAWKRGVRRLLVVCPLSVTLVWAREIARWWPGSPPVARLSAPGGARALKSEGIFLASYGGFSRGRDLVESIKIAPPMDMTVLDEAHALKSTASNRTKAILSELRRAGKLGRVLPMSATPAPNHAGELYPVLRSLRPDLIPSACEPGKPMREAEFKDRYCDIEIISVRVKGRAALRRVEVIRGSKNVDDLRARLSGFFIRETKARVLHELPPLDFDVLPVEVADKDVLSVLDPFMDDETRLRRLQAGGEGVAAAYHALGVAKVDAVVEYVRDWLDGNSRRQILVCAVHRVVIDRLTEGFFDLGVVKLDGRDSVIARAGAIDQFLAGRARVFVLQVHAGGAGLTLVGPKTRCADVVFAESSFSPMENYQAACRVHRIGQRDGVLARLASAAGTYDDRIQEILARKTKDFAELFDLEPQKEIAQ